MRKEKIYNESTSREFYDGLYRSIYASGASSIVTESIILRIKNYEAEKDQYIERLEKCVALITKELKKSYRRSRVSMNDHDETEKSKRGI